MYFKMFRRPAVWFVTAISLAALMIDWAYQGPRPYGDTYPLHYPTRRGLGGVPRSKPRDNVDSDVIQPGNQLIRISETDKSAGNSDEDSDGDSDRDPEDPEDPERDPEIDPEDSTEVKKWEILTTSERTSPRGRIKTEDPDEEHSHGDSTRELKAGQSDAPQAKHVAHQTSQPVRSSEDSGHVSGNSPLVDSSEMSGTDRDPGLHFEDDKEPRHAIPGEPEREVIFSSSISDSLLPHVSSDQRAVENRPPATQLASAAQLASATQLASSDVSSQGKSSRIPPQMVLSAGNLTLGPIEDESWLEEEKVEQEGCTTPYALKSFLERLAVNKTLVCCSINWGFRALFVNWLISVDKLGMTNNILIFAEDVASYRFVETHWPGHAVLLCHSAPSKSMLSDSAGAPQEGKPQNPSSGIPQELGVQHWNTEGYGKLMRGRPFNILACLRHGYTILYTDADTVFMQNPIPFIKGETGGGRGGEGGEEGDGGKTEGKAREGILAGGNSHSEARSVREGGGGREALGELERGGSECDVDQEIDAAGAWDGPLRDEMFNGFNCLPLSQRWKDLNVCGYLLFLRPTQLSLHLMRRWIHRMWSPLKKGSGPALQNQPPFNEVLGEFRAFFEEMRKERRKANNSISIHMDVDFRFRLLPNKLFPSGHTIKFPDQKEKWVRFGGGNPLVYHSNYRLGLEEKRECLQNNSIWFVNEAPDGSVEWPQLHGQSS